MKSAPEIVTMGCRLNAVESEAMRRAALATGQGGLVIVNTCAVTAEAVRQARQMIRRLARENPARRIVVTGCAAETERETFAAMPEVSRIIGNAVKLAPETWGGVAGKPRAPAPEEPREGRTRAFVAVQNGCDHRCTFCIIPYGRGASRSVPMGEVVREIERLVAEGYPEIVLTGVDLTSYGPDLPGAPTLGTLVGAILRHVPALRRLRLSSLDCIEADPVLLEWLKGEPRLLPHLHLSLQAGDDLTLKRMKRRHARADAIRFCAKLRESRPDFAFGADLIAGFPTETEAMFANTLRLVEECGLAFLHVFPFSPRAGTPAARMPPVPGPVIRERAARLRAAGEAAFRRHGLRHFGRVADILMERGGIARLDDFTPIRLAAPGLPGQVVRARVTGMAGAMLTGEIAA